MRPFIKGLELSERFYREAVAPIFYDILTGKTDPDAGLDQMAQKAEAELTALGYRK